MTNANTVVRIENGRPRRRCLMCLTAYRQAYWRNHRNVQLKLCNVCGTIPTERGGKCPGCRQDKSNERRLLKARASRAARTCIVCDLRPVVARDRCAQCKGKRALEYRYSYQRGWQRRNRDKITMYQRRHRLAVWNRLIEGYGGGCRCCGESEPAFLTLDHVNRDGKAHRQRIRNLMTLYNELIAQGFPTTIQLLCWNCHMAKDKRGGCPHEKARQ